MFTDNQHGFLTKDGKFSKISGARPVTGLGDEAFMIDGANDTTITAKLLGRWRNAFVLTDYTGSVRSTLNSVFSHRGLTQTQNAEAATTDAAGDVLASLRSARAPPRSRSGRHSAVTKPDWSL